MKKILGISLVAVLAMSPMMANAGPAANLDQKDPGATQTGLTQQQEAAITAAAPKYAEKTANDQTDGRAATAGYVKGAYNALIKGINALEDEYDDAYDTITDDYATKAGTVATINEATGSGTTSNSSINITGVTITTSNATVGGDIDIEFTPMADWDNDAPAQNAITETLDYSSAALVTTNASVALENATVAGNVNGHTVTGDVTVGSYHAFSGFTPGNPAVNPNNANNEPVVNPVLPEGQQDLEQGQG